ncbi:MAG TPA: redoxin domain-containing protein [Chthoniobacteraceae bacterium]|nr:redoxin domain-containing protein [Chthoniobacteraceae bacterium]
MHRAFVPVLACFIAGASLGAESKPDITVKSYDGRDITPLAATGRKATVLVFMMHDCPVTNASTAELGRLAAEFESQGVRFFGVYATETPAEATAHRRDYRLAFDSLLDPGLRLAKLVGATRAPEAAVVSPEGTILYRGRIDDRATKPGTMRPTARRRDLHLALEAVIHGREPAPRFTDAIGCYLSAK